MSDTFYDWAQRYLRERPPIFMPKARNSLHLHRGWHRMAYDFGDTNINKKEHMTKFNKGDIVKRVADLESGEDAARGAAMRKGNEYVVESATPSTLRVKGIGTAFYDRNFALVKAAKPPFNPVRAKDLKVGDWIRMPKGQATTRNNAGALKADKPYRVKSVQVGCRWFLSDNIYIDDVDGDLRGLNLAEGYSLDHMEKCDPPVGYREKPVRVVSAHEVDCASGDGATLTINFDPNGADNGGPCVDFEITDADNNNIVDIEDIKVLDDLIHKMQDIRTDFVRAQRQQAAR